MSFRFFRRVKIAPGVHVNLSKSGGSLSFGPRGAALTVGTSGVRATAGIPGTGLYYTKQISSRAGASRSRRSSPQVARPEPITLGFFESIFASPDKLALVDGLKALTAGDESKALECFRKSTEIADGAFLAAFLSAKEGSVDDACQYLEKVTVNMDDLGKEVRGLGIDAVIPYPITPEITADVRMDRVGWMLLAAEVYQMDGDTDKALACTAMTLAHHPDDPTVRLSFIELLSEVADGGDSCCRAVASVVRDRTAKSVNANEHSSAVCNELAAHLDRGSRGAWSQIVEHTKEVANVSEVHGGILLYRARALRALGLPKAARQTLTNTLRRKKGRPERLMKALRYERSFAYAETRQRARARGDLEILYSMDPDYEDVSALLGLD